MHRTITIIKLFTPEKNIDIILVRYNNTLYNCKGCHTSCFTHGLILCINFFVEHPSSGVVLIILLIIGRFFIFDLGRSLNAGHGGLLDGEPAELLVLLPSLVREE